MRSRDLDRNTRGRRSGLHAARGHWDVKLIQQIIFMLLCSAALPTYAAHFQSPACLLWD